MTNYKENFNSWLESPLVDNETKDELKSLIGNEKEIEERFYRDLEFGTAGMRGTLGAGTNKMNIYMVRKASQGVATHINSLGEDAAMKGVLIGYDTRNFSREFAEETAKVLVANGIKAYLFDSVHSVPEVSFAIRTLGTSAGVMITASHNPKEYNGYKVYGADGGQLPPDAAAVVTNAINSFDIFNDIKICSLEDATESGLLEIVGKDLDEKFLETIEKLQINPDAVSKVKDSFNIIYTPLHGTGSRPVQAILNRIGFDNLLVVKEQDNEDGNFSTVKSPNPEDKEAFEIAIKMAKENNVDLIIGTDPDCDRVGIVVRDAEGIYQTLTGNQTGALLCEYILESLKKKGELPKNGVIIKTIVTTELAKAIADAYGIEIMNVLTGFKYIGEKMTEFAKTGSHQYLIGFEESYGYLVGTHARDKDAVVASMLIAEMAAYYKNQGLSLYEVLENIYKKYGYFAEKTVSFTMPGKDGMEKMAELLKNIRTNPPKSVDGKEIISMWDYKTQIIKNKTEDDGVIENLPKADVMKFILEDQKSYFIIRPSGTEPKIKFYMASVADNRADANKNIENILADLKAKFSL